jgi:hypothetical protein
MPFYSIGGIRVDFPHEAYECQQVFMSKVIEALDKVDYLQHLSG